MARVKKGVSGKYFIGFRIGKQRFRRTLKTKELAKAKAYLETVQENLYLLQRGRLEIPKGADVISFLLSNGKVTTKEAAAASLKLSELFDKYFGSLPEGSLEESTLYTMGIHRNTLTGFFGGSALAEGLVIQDFINARAEESISPVTIKKEIGTLRTVWNFGKQNKLISDDFPRGLRFPKGQEKPPYMVSVRCGPYCEA